MLLMPWLVTAGASEGLAQPFEQSGVRAQGLAGAFVAVADDASAVWWNPAGLADGPFFNLLIEHQHQPDPGSRLTALAIATPPLGVSYQRLRQFLPAAADPRSGRNTESGDVPSAPAVVHEAGITLLHSVTSGFVVGSTVKFVRGHVSGGGTNRLDVDLGAQYRVAAVRAGIVVRNLAEPSFRAPDGTRWVRQREVRLGVAWAAGERTTVSADADLTKVLGPWPGRQVAVGVDQRIGQRLAVRGGVRFRPTGDAGAWVAAGGSYAVRSGIWLDGFWGRSPDQDARWGISARVAY
jgi:hypothetical protein